MIAFAKLTPHRASLAAALLTAVTLCAAARPSSAQEKPSPAPRSSDDPGVVFKAPKGYMEAPLTDFRGLFFLDPKRPAGIFIFYPNDNETTDALRQRIRATVGPMVLNDAEEAKRLKWNIQPLPAHPGDVDGAATAAVYTGVKQEVQVVVYERLGPANPFLYGYFAKREKGEQGGAKFLDAEGRGVKEFDAFWKSFAVGK